MQQPAFDGIQPGPLAIELPFLSRFSVRPLEGSLRTGQAWLVASLSRLMAVGIRPARKWASPVMY